MKFIYFYIKKNLKIKKNNKNKKYNYLILSNNLGLNQYSNLLKKI